jgi:hypothetical protein
LSRFPLRRVALGFLALALAALSVAGCSSGSGSDSSGFRSAIDRLATLIRQHPGVASVTARHDDELSWLKSGDATVVLTTRATPDEILAVVRDVAGELAAEAFDDASFSVLFNQAESRFTIPSFSRIEFPAWALDTEVRAWIASTASHPTDVSIGPSGPGGLRPYKRTVVIEVEPGASPDRIGAVFQELASRPLPPADEATWLVRVPDPRSQAEQDLGVSNYHFSGDLPAEPIPSVVEDVAAVAELAGPDDRVYVDLRATPTRLDLNVIVTAAGFDDNACAADSRIAGSTAERLGRAYQERLEASSLSYELTAGVCRTARFLDVSGGP